MDVIATLYFLGKDAMKIRKHIFGAILLIFAGLGFAYIVYSGLVFYQAERLNDKGEGIKEGMTEDEVVKIMGKPKHSEWVDSVNRMDIRKADIERIVEIEKANKKLKRYIYYVSVYKIPSFRKRGSGTMWIIYFDDRNETVVYVSWIISVGGYY